MKRFLALVAAAAFAVSSCGGEPDPDDPNQRQIDIYSAVIPTVVTHERPDLSDLSTLDLVVFVAGREEVDIPFEVQVGVVNALESWATIRFIDQYEEALIGVDDERTVRDGGVLVQLATIPAGRTSVAVTADRYESPEHLLTFEIELRRRAGEWHVVEPVEVTSVTLRG